MPVSRSRHQFNLWHYYWGRSVESNPTHVAALIGVLGATIIEFNKISPTAAYLLLPYLGWTSYATALTYAVWKLNPKVLLVAEPANSFSSLDYNLVSLAIIDSRKTSLGKMQHQQHTSGPTVILTACKHAWVPVHPEVANPCILTAISHPASKHTCTKGLVNGGTVRPREVRRYIHGILMEVGRSWWNQDPLYYTTHGRQAWAGFLCGTQETAQRLSHLSSPHCTCN